MEAFNFLNLWKTSPVVAGDLIPPPEYDDEEAFFDLELLNYEHKQDLNLHKKIKFTSESNDVDYDKNSPKSTDYSRSPISFLRSPPTFFKFKRNKVSGSASTTPVLSRTNSSSSRKASNGVVHKYLRLIKIKISGESESEDSPSRKGAVDGMRSPSLRIVCRRSGKSRGSALPAAAAYVPSLRSDSVVQRDGIQSAILHCKRSFNSSPTDLSVLSRSVSEPVILENLSRFSIEQKKRINI